MDIILAQPKDFKHRGRWWFIPVFSSGVVETAVGLCIVEERVETGLKTTQSSL